MSTYFPTPLTIDRKWFVVDASGKNRWVASPLKPPAS